MMASQTMLLQCRNEPLGAHGLVSRCVGWKQVCCKGRLHRLKAPQASRQQALLFEQMLATALSGAVLGPLLDAQHSRYHVLQYEHPLRFEVHGLGYTLETCWWVPVLFGVAGIILGTGQPWLDDLFAQSTGFEAPRPGWMKVLIGIGIFVVHYWASGFFADKASNLQLLALLQASALAFWWTFDQTLQGLALAAVTSLCGPAIEVGLINIGHLYHYTQPSFLGVPAWIGSVYFCGAPAVGNLGRIIQRTLLTKGTQKRW